MKLVAALSATEHIWNDNVVGKNDEDGLSDDVLLASVPSPGLASPCPSLHHGPTDEHRAVNVRIRATPGRPVNSITARKSGSILYV